MRLFPHRLRPSAAAIILGAAAVPFAQLVLAPPSISEPAAQVPLYERLAAGPLVVHGRCSGGGRRAPVEVLSILRGDYGERTLSVSYRSENYNRAPGSPRVDFQPGTESILVLEPEHDSRGRSKGGGRFVLAGGWRGKIDLPAEGAPALLAAARRLTEIQALKNQKEVWDAHRSLLEEPNPYLVTAGFDEVLKFRLGDESLAPSLLRHLGSRRPEFRRQSLRVIGQIFARQKRTGDEIASADLLLREALARANGDESAENRAEAVKALRALGDPSLSEALSHLAAHDPSQLVRYEARIALLELRREH